MNIKLFFFIQVGRHAVVPLFSVGVEGHTTYYKWFIKLITNSTFGGNKVEYLLKLVSIKGIND